MKNQNLHLHARWSLIVSLTVGLSLILGGGSLSTSPAWASDSSPIATPKPPNHSALEQNLKKAHLELKEQAKQLKQTRKKIAKAQALIKKQAAQGRDVSPLQGAVKTFKAQLKNVQLAQKNAQQILAANVGFNAKGKVTDPNQAKQTVHSARQAIQQAKATLKQAVAEFDQAVQAFK